MYDEIAASYNALHAEEQKRKFQALIQYVDLDEIETVADIGCGTAHLAPYFKDKTYIGIDPSQGLLKQAPENTEVILAPGEKLPLPDNSQDITLSLTALHNYDDPSKGVKELFRITKNVALIGVLKKGPRAQEIYEQVKSLFNVTAEPSDQHDFLLVCHKA